MLENLHSNDTTPQTPQPHRHHNATDTHPNKKVDSAACGQLVWAFASGAAAVSGGAKGVMLLT